ncbi:MAG: hypothetical protein M3R65_07875 [Gemmatimonadota bacterium]|nr:hypothetical protein [Gemmatimonadota bacterium]
MKLEALPLHFRQFVEYARDTGECLASLRRRGRPRVGAHGPTPPFPQTLSAAFPFIMPARDTACNRIQPVAKISAGRGELPCLPDDNKERFLGDILGVIAVSYDLFCKQRDRADKLLDERFDRLGLPFSHASKHG